MRSKTAETAKNARDNHHPNNTVQMMLLGNTVEILIMHKVIMHNFENALSLGGNDVRPVCPESKLHNA
jgi:hypothetical protein